MAYTIEQLVGMVDEMKQTQATSKVYNFILNRFQDIFAGCSAVGWMVGSLDAPRSQPATCVWFGSL